MKFVPHIWRYRQTHIRHAHACSIRCDRINRYVQVGDWIAYIGIWCDERINNKTRLIYLRYRPIWFDQNTMYIVYWAMAGRATPRRTTTTPHHTIVRYLNSIGLYSHTHTFLVKHCKTNRFCIPKLLSLMPNIVDNIQYVHLEHFVPAGNLQNISTWTHMRTHYSHTVVSGASAAMNNGHQPKRAHTHTLIQTKGWRNGIRTKLRWYICFWRSPFTTEYMLLHITTMWKLKRPRHPSAAEFPVRKCVFGGSKQRQHQIIFWMDKLSVL